MTTLDHLSVWQAALVILGDEMGGAPQAPEALWPRLIGPVAALKWVFQCVQGRFRKDPSWL